MAPAATAKAGTRYQALMNLSVPRPGDADKQTDLVMAGETVILTDEQARSFLEARPPRIRKASEAGQVRPLITPRQVSGPLRGPGAEARPDPAGSSHIQVYDVIPESGDPHGEDDGEPDQDALDIPPRARATAGAR